MFNLDPYWGRTLGSVISEILTRELKGTKVQSTGPEFKILGFHIPDDPGKPYFRNLMVEVKQLGTVGPEECVVCFPYLPAASHVTEDMVIEGKRFTCHGYTCLATEANGFRDQKNRKELDQIVGKHKRQIERLIMETMAGVTINWDYFQRCCFRSEVAQKTKEAMLWLLVAMGILTPARSGWETYEDFFDQTFCAFNIEVEGHKLVFSREEDAKELAVALEAQKKRLDIRHKRGNITHCIQVVNLHKGG